MANHCPLTTFSFSIGTDSAATSSGAHMKMEYVVASEDSRTAVMKL